MLWIDGSILEKNISDVARNQQVGAPQVVQREIGNITVPWNGWMPTLKGLQINLYLEQPMEIQLFAKFFQRTVNFKIIEYTSKIKKSIYYSVFHM
jgi:hypothetical protein